MRHLGDCKDGAAGIQNKWTEKVGEPLAVELSCTAWTTDARQHYLVGPQTDGAQLMKRVWTGLSPWLDIPMNQRHWKLLCVFAIASTPLGFGLGQLARRRYERLEVPAPERHTQRETESNRQTVAERNREKQRGRDAERHRDRV